MRKHDHTTARKILLLTILLCFNIGCIGDIDTSSTEPSVLKYEPFPPIENSAKTPILTYALGYESGEITLHWSVCDGVEHYELEETSFFFGMRTVYFGKGLKYESDKIPKGVYLEYRVRANYGMYVSKWSNSIYIFQ